MRSPWHPSAVNGPNRRCSSWKPGPLFRYDPSFAPSAEARSKTPATPARNNPPGRAARRLSQRKCSQTAEAGAGKPRASLHRPGLHSKQNSPNSAELWDWDTLWTARGPSASPTLPAIAAFTQKLQNIPAEACSIPSHTSLQGPYPHPDASHPSRPGTPQQSFMDSIMLALQIV